MSHFKCSGSPVLFSLPPTLRRTGDYTGTQRNYARAIMLSVFVLHIFMLFPNFHSRHPRKVFGLSNTVLSTHMTHASLRPPRGLGGSHAVFLSNYYLLAKNTNKKRKTTDSVHISKDEKYCKRQKSEFSHKFKKTIIGVYAV